MDSTDGPVEESIPEDQMKQLMEEQVRIVGYKHSSSITLLPVVCIIVLILLLASKIMNQP